MIANPTQQEQIANHPLNLAATELLKQNQIQLQSELMPILQVAAEVYQSEGKEGSPEAILLAQYSQMEPLMVLELLSEELEPETLTQDSLQEAAQAVIQALTPMDPYRDLR